MDEINTRIKELGIPENLIEATNTVLSELVLISMFNEFIKVSSQEEVNIMTKRLSTAKSQEHYNLIIKEIAIIIYGDKQEESIKKLYTDNIDALKKMIVSSHDYLQKLEKGDKETIAKLTKIRDYYYNEVFIKKP